MQVSVLGSCTVIEYPAEIEKFFSGDNLIDVRHASNMEMDSLPLFFLADASDDIELKKRIVKGLLVNLEQSGGDLWKCGMWGHEEVHLRFTSVALRLMLIFKDAFDEKLVARVLRNHLSHHEEIFGGIWFFHDSIETYDQAYYKTWQGSPCLDASNNNMLIINTHIDTLVTLLVARKNNVDRENAEVFIHKALAALQQFISETPPVSALGSWIDRLFRACVLRGLGNRDIVSRVTVRLLDSFYYRRLRYRLKHKKNIRQFRDGFLERDVRLTGPSLDYHVVNIWDMSRLLLWLKYNQMENLAVEETLGSSIKSAMRYCYNSTSYRLFMQRLSMKKGVSNELLESIAIMMVLGTRENWMAKLYLKWRRFSPRSVGIMGLDRSISGELELMQAFRPDSLPDNIDWISFESGFIFVANNGDDFYRLTNTNLECVWSNGKVDEKLKGALHLEGKTVAVIKLVES